MPPTIVLVHGAFAESSSWNRMIDLLRPEHRVIAAANPLRDLATDAETVSDLVRSIDGPVILVAHSLWRRRDLQRRAGRRRQSPASGASHACGVSRPDETADMIREAAAVGVAA
jgi:hypothetical protein